jgi:hypothetical protein
VSAKVKLCENKMASTEEAEYNNNLLSLTGNELFDHLEKQMSSKISPVMRKILLINDVDCIGVIGRVDNVYIQRIESFMKDDLNADMLETGETLKDYLGVYSKCQKQFKFTPGQTIVLRQMVDLCKKFVHPDKNPGVPSSAGANGEIVVASELYEVEQSFATPTSPDENDLFYHIGALMITVFNDAKRTTLSGWSFPSRIVTAELARNFKWGRGLTSITNFDLRYVTPGSHAKLLACIVDSDTVHITEALTKSLAVSLRFDGSVDRTQKHNVFVMAQIVKDDVEASIVTVYLGFDTPKSKGAIGYLNCLKRITKKFLPWKDFLALITSVVTDGESLNLGRLNGLIAKLKALRNLSPSNSPLISIWCVPHRTNLAWKSTSKLNIIDKLIIRARKLSKHFRSSGKRTQKLRTIAANEKLQRPVRYPAFFAVRWVEYVFKLLNAVLRNWYTSMKYFQSENLTSQLNFWTQYNTLHFTVFLTDVLSLVKRFQKSCQSDTINLLDVNNLKQSLFENLEKSKHTHVEEGWEELFLRQTVINTNNAILRGIQLKTATSTIITRTTRNNRATKRILPLFTPTTRQHIIGKLIQDLKMRLDLDLPLIKAFEPLLSINSLASLEDLKMCHAVVAPDIDENIFISDYYNAAALLNNDESCNPHEALKKLIEISPHHLSSIKSSLARILAAKPHSADVERLISEYS